MAADLDRWLAGEPLVARPIGAGARAWRWCRRKPAIAGLASATALLLLAVAIGSPIALIRIQREAESRRESLYASEMNAAFNAWNEGRAVRARELLAKQLAGAADLRSFDWYYLNTLSQTNELFTLAKAGSWTIALSPDGKTMASTVDGMLKLWDIAAREAKITIPTKAGPGYSIAYSPDGRMLATAHSHQKARCVKLWDVANGNLLGELPQTGKRTGADQRALWVAFSPDSKTIVTTDGAPYKGGAVSEIKLWDVATRRELRALHGHASWVFQAVFSPDGEVIAGSGGDGTVTLWNASTGAIVGKLQKHNGFTIPVTFAHSGRFLAVGDEEGYVWLWDWRERHLEVVFHAHQAPVYSLAFSPDDRYLATGSRDHTAKLWDYQTRRALATFAGHEGRVTSVNFTSDGQKVVTSSADGNVKFWNAAVGPHDNTFATHSGEGSGVLFTPDGRYLAGAEFDPKVVTVWDASRGVPLKTWPGRNIGASLKGNILAILQESKVLFIEAGTLLESGVVECGSGLGGRLAFSPDGKWLAVRSAPPENSEIVILDVIYRRKIKALKVDREEWAPLAFAQAGKLLLAASDSSIRVWDVAHWREPRPLPGHEGGMIAMAVSPDGRTVATGGYDSVVRVWDMEHRNEVVQLRSDAGAVYSIAFSPDGRTLAVGTHEGVIKLWNLPADQEVCTIRAHSSITEGLSFSPDGQTLASISYDKTLRLWHAPRLEQTNSIRLGP